MFDILQYDFFQNALLWWILIWIISSILWVFIIMRKEANITHSISNFLFLGIAISLFLVWNYYLYAFIFAILASIIIFIIEKTSFITKESSKEIISQFGLAMWIFVIWFIWNLSLDINNLLFWNILFINKLDLVIMWVFFIIIMILFIIFKNTFLSIIINPDIAKSMWKKVEIYNFFFLLILSIFIWISIKIFWVLLIWAFLVIPANRAKILWNSLKQMFIYTIIISILWVILWLFGSYYIWSSSSSSIVLVLIIIFVIWVIYRVIKNM